MRASISTASLPGTCTYTVEGACRSPRTRGSPTTPSLPIVPTSTPLFPISRTSDATPSIVNRRIEFHGVLRIKLFYNPTWSTLQVAHAAARNHHPKTRASGAGWSSPGVSHHLFFLDLRETSTCKLSRPHRSSHSPPGILGSMLAGSLCCSASTSTASCVIASGLCLQVVDDPCGHSILGARPPDRFRLAREGIARYAYAYSLAFLLFVAARGEATVAQLQLSQCGADLARQPQGL